MSIFCGGDESWFTDIFYTMKHHVRSRKDQDKCPRCGKGPFIHGHFPSHNLYCTNCNLFHEKIDRIDKIDKNQSISIIYNIN